MKKILLINTGGTIAMSEDQKTGKVSPSQHNPLLKQSTFFNTLADLEVVDLYNLPSPHITPQEMLRLSHYIRDHVASFDGVVVTHGTDTLEETAYFLDLTLQIDQPVVVTGAMRSSNEIGSDGLANLRSAILVASAASSCQRGVLVVMNEEIHTATYVTKTHTTNVATFQTPTFGPIGLVAKSQVIYFQNLIRREYYPVTQMTQPVALLKSYAGMAGDLIQAVSQSGYQGLVIEGLGAGNLPPATLQSLEAIIKQGLPVVMVSRAFNGVIEDIYDYTGGGKKLRQMGVIFAQGLSGVKARIKLLVLLNSDQTVAIDQAFRL